MFDIPILMLHSVNPAPELHPMGSLSIYPDEFDAYLKVINQSGYQMISMTDLLSNNYDAAKPLIVLTFDDGFKDTLTVSLPILRKYGARGTVFVNPMYFGDASDMGSEWGFMTTQEIKQAEASGCLDIQAHTMTHEFIFISDRIIDFYTPNAFNQYYWLAWMLYPESTRRWDSNAYHYRELIPTGYPIFEYGRRLSSESFMPSESYVSQCIDLFGRKGISAREELNALPEDKGVQESHDEFLRVAAWQIGQCKTEIEGLLEKPVHTLCFPGGGYTPEILDIAHNAGYRCYMYASRLRHGNNIDNLKEILGGSFAGMNRMSFSQRRFAGIPHRVTARIVAKLTLDSYQNKPVAKLLKGITRKI